MTSHDMSARTVLPGGVLAHVVDPNLAAFGEFFVRVVAADPRGLDQDGVALSYTEQALGTNSVQHRKGMAARL